MSERDTWNLQKWPLLQNLPWALATSCERLRTVADGCGQLRTVADCCEQLRTVAQRRANTPSTPRPPEWNGNPCYAFGKSLSQKDVPHEFSVNKLPLGNHPLVSSNMAGKSSIVSWFSQRTKPPWRVRGLFHNIPKYKYKENGSRSNIYRYIYIYI